MIVFMNCRNICEAADRLNRYTASFAFFEAIWEVCCMALYSTNPADTLQAGITHCFVNLGSDHPSIIEAMVKGQNEKKGQFPNIITCPNEVRRPPSISHQWV